jgi:hypothetical protein
MRRVPCPDCGRKIRPSNLKRHRAARHIPRVLVAEHGVEFTVPQQPIKQKPGKDRRYDDIAPRGVGPYRFRIYRLRAGDLQMLAAVETPEDMGRELVKLHSEGRFSVPDDAVGILDTAEDPGDWIANPWALGRRVT